MTEKTIGWVSTTANDRLQDFLKTNILNRTTNESQNQKFRNVKLEYDLPRSPSSKQWTDQTLLSSRNLNAYLAESDAFQRATLASFVQKRKDYDKDKNDRLISLFDNQYNMKLRFRQDEKLNRASEKKYAPIAKYYRLLGNENNSKNSQPCIRHARRTREYHERQLQNILQLSPIKGRNSQYGSLSNLAKLPPIESNESSQLFRSSESVAEASRHTFS